MQRCIYVSRKSYAANDWTKETRLLPQKESQTVLLSSRHFGLLVARLRLWPSCICICVPSGRAGSFLVAPSESRVIRRSCPFLLSTLRKDRLGTRDTSALDLRKVAFEVLF